MATVCDDSNDGVINYTASITGLDGEMTSSINVKSEHCRETTCSVVFVLSTEIISSTVEFRVTLSASNLAGSTSIEYSDPICMSTLCLHVSVCL